MRRSPLSPVLEAFAWECQTEMFFQCLPKGKDILLCTQISMLHPSAPNPELMSDLACGKQKELLSTSSDAGAETYPYCKYIVRHTYCEYGLRMNYPSLVNWPCVSILLLQARTQDHCSWQLLISASAVQNYGFSRKIRQRKESSERQNLLL